MVRHRRRGWMVEDQRRRHPHAGCADQPHQFLAAHTLGGGSTGVMVDLLFYNRAINIVGAWVYQGGWGPYDVADVLMVSPEAFGLRQRIVSLERLRGEPSRTLESVLA